MAKARIIIADTDESYIQSIQLKFVEEFFEKIDLEIITDKEYFESLFSVPQRAEILIVSEDLYDMSIQKHNISHVFLMTEQYEEEQTAELNINRIFKYTSIKEIFNEIMGKSADALNIENNGKKETQVVVVTSTAGGVGKTTVAMGLSASLAQNYKKVLYLNVEQLQTFQCLLKNTAPISNSEIYARILQADELLYTEIKHVLRTELFSYLPPLKASMMSLGVKRDIYFKFIEGAKKSNDYDFIIIDTDSVFDEDKAELIDKADKVIFVTKQNAASVEASNILVSNINGINTEKYIYICNDFDKERDNALISPDISLKFSINEYTEHLSHYDTLKGVDLARYSCFQKMAYLLI